MMKPNHQNAGRIATGRGKNAPRRAVFALGEGNCCQCGNVATSQYQCCQLVIGNWNWRHWQYWQQFHSLPRKPIFRKSTDATYRDNLQIRDFATTPQLPEFSYPQILNEARRIDVIWFNRKGLAFPQRVFEVVDSIGTLNGAFNRSLQLRNFRTDFFIVASEKHHDKYLQTLELEAYQPNKGRFTFVNYDDMISLYENTMRAKKVEDIIFG